MYIFCPFASYGVWVGITFLSSLYELVCYAHVFPYRCQFCCYGHTLKLYNDDCTDNAARTKDKHQSDSEERHTRELQNYIAVPRLYLSTLYNIIVDRYMYLHTCNEVTRLVAMFSVSLTVTVFWQDPCKEPENSLLLAGRGQHSICDN